MTGSGIYDGDLLIIDRAEEAKTGNVVAVNFNGEFVVKVIDIENRMLHSTNPAVRPVYINDLDVCTIEGVVTSSVRLHKPRWLISSGADA